MLIDSDYCGVRARVRRAVLEWYSVAWPFDFANLPEGRAGRLLRELDHSGVSLHAKVEHPFRVNRRLFGLMKMHARRLATNRAHLARKQERWLLENYRGDLDRV